MKKRIIFLSLLLSGMCFAPQIFAQKTLSEEEKVKANKELKMVQEAMEKQQQAVTIQKEEMAKRSEEYSKQFEKALKKRQIMSPTERDFFYGRIPEPPMPTYSVYSSDKSSTLTLHKNFREESASKKTSYTVGDDAKRIRFNIHGGCREGSIQIKLLLPSGKVFNHFEIDSTADISWTQSIKIEEGNKKYMGEWTIEIKATKASGDYSLSISSI